MVEVMMDNVSRSLLKNKNSNTAAGNSGTRNANEINWQNGT